MEINVSSLLSIRGNEVQPAESQVDGKSRKTARQPDGVDRLELSERSQDISRLTELINAVPDVREDRIEQLRTAIASGNYNVKAEVIAEKMMGDHLLDDVI